MLTPSAGISEQSPLHAQLIMNCTHVVQRAGVCALQALVFVGSLPNLYNNQSILVILSIYTVVVGGT